MVKLFPWVPFFEKFADKLSEYENKRNELYKMIKEASLKEPLMEYLHFERDDWWKPRNYHIDPFTVIGIINRQISVEQKIKFAKLFDDLFNIKIPIPNQFDGIPVMNNLQSVFGGMDQIWELFIQALQYPSSGIFNTDFKTAFEKAIKPKGNGLPSITMGLFWARPNEFMPLDKNSCSYIRTHYKIDTPKEDCSGEEYIDFLQNLRKALDQDSREISFPEVSYEAWKERKPDTATKKIASNSKPSLDTKEDTRKREQLPKNIIIYGPPGTGKTYSTIQYAVAIIEEKSFDEVKQDNYENAFKRYLQYKEDGLVAFTTFHQSFSYEEFIEGIRPVVFSEEKTESNGQIEYVVHDGIFKTFCDKAGTPITKGEKSDIGIGKNPAVWKISLEGTGDNPTRSECMENNHIRIGWDSYGETISDATDYKKDGGSVVLNAFYNRMQIGDIILSCYSSKTIDAIGVVTGEPEWHNEYQKYKRLRKVKWLVKGINEDIVDFNAGKTMTLSTVYKLSVSASDALQIVKKYNTAQFSQKMKIPNRVFIIDEINRGNISKIFGELITLIEPSKRINAHEQIRSILPYSGQNFGVPDNVYIIGTMNTADRSIAMIDTALRRRFHFIEMLPEPEILKGVFVEGLNISRMLNSLNERISILLDREHTLGHSYLLSLKDDPTIENLSKIFSGKIVPLLQEYFYDDYEKIALVLGDNRKSDNSIRFVVKKTDAYEKFGDIEISFSPFFEINRKAFSKIEAYEFLQ